MRTYDEYKRMTEQRLNELFPAPSAEFAQGEAPAVFHQCKACGFAALDEGALVEHILAAHLGDYYEAKEVECEPPKGNFSCVAKCGLSGVLLGPPNIHEFNSVVRDMMRTRYPDMTEEQYRSHIEMVRDAESIEEWRKGATKRTLYFAKGAAEGAEGLTLEQAEGEFKRTFLAPLMDAPKNLMITVDAALKSPVRPLQWAVRDAVEAERPYAIDCPAILICGEKDHAGDVKPFNRTWAAGDGLDLRWIAGAGHNSNTDKPDEVNAIIEELLERVRG